ncbi:Uncharacterised protein [Mycobacteroides abscessus subsp. abscessus]|nr:Uncharacterised protein [Mycobacteroides abscessus subsp. abscessus]
MVRVIPAMGRQVECHGQALLARRQVAAVERVGLGGRGETRVLANGPRLIDVHRRIRPAQEGHLTREGIQRITLRPHRLAVGGRVDRLDGDRLRRLPIKLLGTVSVRGGGLAYRGLNGGGVRGDGYAVTVQRYIGKAAQDGAGFRKIREVSHVTLPMWSAWPKALRQH